MTVSMRSLADLPGVKCAACFAAGVLVADACPGMLVTALCAGLAAIAAWSAYALFPALRARQGAAVRGGALLVLVAAAGYVRTQEARTAIDTGLVAYSDTRDKYEMTAVATTEPVRKPWSVNFRCRLVALHAPVDTAFDAEFLMLYSTSAFDAMDALTDVTEGDTVRCTGSIRTPRAAVNPHGFDYRAYLARQGLTATVIVAKGGDLRVTGRPRGFQPWRDALGAVRASLRRAIDARFTGDRRAVMAGLILGERGAISDDINDDFRNAGVYHILSVSGSHVAVVLAALWLALGRMRRQVKTTVVLPILVFYAALTGGDAPVVRSVVMAALLLVGTLWQRVTNPVNILAVAALAILAWSPMELFDIGFQLSFAAVFALVVYHPVVTQYLRRAAPRAMEHPLAGRALGMLAMTFVAQAGTTPLIMAYFGQLSIVSFVANLVIVPLVSLCIAAALPALCCDWLGAWPSAWFAATSDAALAVVLHASDVLGRLPFAVVYTGVWPAWLALGFAALWAWLFQSSARIPRRMAIALLIAGCAVLAASFASSGDAPRLHVTMLDVGQGDAILIESPNGRRLLVDAGPSGRSGDAGRRIIVPYLRARGITAIDGLVVTHPDDDHLGGAASLLGMIRLGTVWRAGAWPATAQTAIFDSTMRTQGVEDVRPRQGGDIALDRDMRLRVLWPDSAQARAAASNNTSIVLRLEYGETSLLLCGDAEAEVEDALMARYGELLHADIVKLGHHGSRTSSSPRFLAAVGARDALIPCGRLNRFRHPSPIVLGRLAGMAVHRTDLDGAIRISSDGRKWRIIDD